MSNCPFCNLDPAPTSSGAKRPTDFLRRAWRGIQWAFPATLLVLIPKCPFCVAAYVALFTGIGVSVSTARWIQVLMLVFCLGSLAYLVVRYWRRSAKIRLFGVPHNRRLRIFRIVE
jgi:hypothetical protein